MLRFGATGSCGLANFPASREGLKAGRVFCVAIDRNGDAWFGHQTWMGVGRIRGNEITYFTEADGLTTDAIWKPARTTWGSSASRSRPTR
jgi:hypothetical protein